MQGLAICLEAILAIGFSLAMHLKSKPKEMQGVSSGGHTALLEITVEFEIFGSNL